MNWYRCKYGQGLVKELQAPSKAAAVKLLREMGIPANDKNVVRVWDTPSWRTKIIQ